MTRTEITMKVERVILAQMDDLSAANLNAPNLQAFTDLGIDELDIIQILMSLEEEFEVTIGDALLENVDTVEGLIGYLEELLS